MSTMTFWPFPSVGGGHMSLTCCSLTLKALGVTKSDWQSVSKVMCVKFY